MLMYSFFSKRCAAPVPIRPQESNEPNNIAGKHNLKAANQHCSQLTTIRKGLLQPGHPIRQKFQHNLLEHKHRDHWRVQLRE